MTERNKKIRIGALVLVSLLIGAGVTAAVGTSFSETRYVSYGEVETQQSQVQILGYEENGPGINVDEVAVQTENTADESVTAKVEVWLMSDGEEVRYSRQEVTWESGQSIDVTMEVDRVREHEYDSVDIKIEE